jgi:hypothetical protein
MQDIYKGWEDGIGFTNDEFEVLHRDDDQSLFDYVSENTKRDGGRSPKLFLNHDEDPAILALKWGRRNFIRNMRRRIADEDQHKRFLFERPLANTLRDGEADEYAGQHFVPLRPNSNSKQMFFKVQKRARRFAGAPRVVPRVRLGAAVGNHMAKRSSFRSLSRDTWNVSW